MHTSAARRSVAQGFGIDLLAVQAELEGIAIDFDIRLLTLQAKIQGVINIGIWFSRNTLWHVRIEGDGKTAP